MQIMIVNVNTMLGEYGGGMNSCVQKAHNGTDLKIPAMSGEVSRGRLEFETAEKATFYTSRHL